VLLKTWCRGDARTAKGGGAPLAASSEHSDLKPKKHSDLKPKNFQIHSDAVMLVCPWLGLAVMCVLRHG
jgi:hypothetical protein